MREGTEGRRAPKLEANTDAHAPAVPAAVAGVIACRCGGTISLTPRQIDVLGLVAQGLANKAIAQRLQIAENTVRGYVSDLLAAFQVTNRTRLALEVARRGLLSPAGGVRHTIVMRDSR